MTLNFWIFPEVKRWTINQILLFYQSIYQKATLGSCKKNMKNSVNSNKFFLQIVLKFTILLKYSMKSIIVSTLLATALSTCNNCDQNPKIRKLKTDHTSQPDVVVESGGRLINTNNQQLLNIIHGVQVHTNEIENLNKSYEDMKVQMKNALAGSGGEQIKHQGAETQNSVVGEHSDQSRNIDSVKKQFIAISDQDHENHPNQDVGVYRRNSKQIFRSAAESVQISNTRFDNIFLRFPTCDELDRLIISADTAAILKTIQSIAIDENVPCDKKILYLLELQGRLKTAIEMKVHSAKQLQIVIDASYIQIQKARSEIEATSKLLDGLGFDQLKKSQKKYNKDLQVQYGVLNDVQGQLPILRARVIGFEKEIGILNKDTEAQRAKVDNDRLKLLQVGTQIGKIQSRLRQLQDVQAAIRDRVGRSEEKVGQNDQNVSQLKLKIKTTEQSLKKSKDDHDTANSQVKDLEVKVQRFRTDIAIAESKKDRYLKQISTLQSKLNAEKKKAFNDDLADLNQMISTLKDLVPSVQAAIDRHHYTCYGEGSSVKVQQTGGTTVYVVSGNKFGQYLKNLYGQSVKVPALRQEINLNRVDIFGSEWSGKFGYPFVDSAFKNDDFSFSGSFSCTNPGSVVSGCGTISAIGADYIQAQDEKGSIKKFSLGSCSRLQSSLKIPKIGHKFYWKGVIGSKGYNLYSGSCFQ